MYKNSNTTFEKYAVGIDGLPYSPVNHSKGDLSHRRYRAKLVRLPHGHMEVMVTRPSPESIEAMGQPVRPCDMLPKYRDEEEQAQRDLENKERACRLAKQRVRLLVKCIGADHMVTPTYREVVQDMEKLKRDFKEFVRLVHTRYSEWVYVATFEKQRADEPDWSYHMHLAVKGKQDIKWLRRCWLRAIGQPLDEVNAWYTHGEKLGERSKGAVNVTSPNRRWSGEAGAKWRSNNLAAYMTKYISKEFDSVAKGKKKYWHSKGIDKPSISRFWLGATNFPDAIKEAYNHLFFSGVVEYEKMHSCEELGIVWLTGIIPRDSTIENCELPSDFYD
jgi:hypothetical protein